MKTTVLAFAYSVFKRGVVGLLPLGSGLSGKNIEVHESMVLRRIAIGIN